MWTGTPAASSYLRFPCRSRQDDDEEDTLLCHHLFCLTEFCSLLSLLPLGLACFPFSDLLGCSLDPASDLSFLTCDVTAVILSLSAAWADVVSAPLSSVLSNAVTMGPVHKLGDSLNPLCCCVVATPHMSCQVGGLDRVGADFWPGVCSV